MNKNTNSTQKVIVRNTINNGDFAVTANGDKVSFRLGGNLKTGDFNVGLDIEEGQIAFNGTETGGEQIRQFVDSWEAQREKEWAQTKQELKALVSLIPSGLESLRAEIDKMDDWDDQRSEKRAEKRGMAYISQEKLDQLIEELNELRAQQGEKTTEETTDDFEKVK